MKRLCEPFVALVSILTPLWKQLSTSTHCSVSECITLILCVMFHVGVEYCLYHTMPAGALVCIPKVIAFLLPEIYLLMFGSWFFTNRFNPWNCRVHVAFDNMLCPPTLSKIFLSLGKHKCCLDGPERGVFIPASHLWQWPMQEKCKKYQHGYFRDKPDQFRTLLPSTPKSRAKLNPMTESFKSLRK